MEYSNLFSAWEAPVDQQTCQSYFPVSIHPVILQLPKEPQKAPNILEAIHGAIFL
jgi:hypothetical protein